MVGSLSGRPTPVSNPDGTATELRCEDRRNPHSASASTTRNHPCRPVSQCRWRGKHQRSTKRKVCLPPGVRKKYRTAECVCSLGARFLGKIPPRHGSREQTFSPANGPARRSFLP